MILMTMIFLAKGNYSYFNEIFEKIVVKQEKRNFEINHKTKQALSMLKCFDGENGMRSVVLYKQVKTM